MVKLNISLPEHFLEEEIRCEYKVSEKMKEVWAVELDLLNEFQRVCSKNNLSFFATGGTLLGAVRHQGFIPWDDDIDVAMLREDYEKLKKLGPTEFGNGYFLQSTYTDSIVRQHMQLRKEGTTALGKTEYGMKYDRSIFIDIFVWDKLPMDDDELESFSKELADCYRKIPQPCFHVHRHREDRLIESLKNIVRPVDYLAKTISGGNYRKQFQHFEEIAQRYSAADTDKVYNIVFAGVRQKKIQSQDLNDFEKLIFLPFEFMTIPCPYNYDNVLRRMFGDYMKFVCGGNEHGNLYFDTGNSYKKYDKLTVNEYFELYETCLHTRR